MSLPVNEKNKVIDRYTERFRVHGYSPKTLGWDKGKQDIRFGVLTSRYDFHGKSVLDIGCGFGDLNKTLVACCGGNDYRYHGIDLVQALIDEGRQRYLLPNVRFTCGDILDGSTEGDEGIYDYAIASGIFNFKLVEMDNYAYIESVIRTALRLCREGVAFDFLSDKVDRQYEHTFHSSPEKILGIAFKYSRNVILRNDYMPFEFALFINKDDSFLKEDTVFNHFRRCGSVF